MGAAMLSGFVQDQADYKTQAAVDASRDQGRPGW
jgi:hypothetical protein